MAVLPPVILHHRRRRRLKEMGPSILTDPAFMVGELGSLANCFSHFSWELREYGEFSCASLSANNFGHRSYCSSSRPSRVHQFGLWATRR
uniref:Uncharacterized protein n=1 Tax=Noccaea caerulescens TaxID=107243 RepID=A0A1J3H7V2_NOCCA